MTKQERLLEVVYRMLDLLDEEHADHRSVARLRQRIQEVELFELRKQLHILRAAAEAVEQEEFQGPRRYETLS